MKLYLLVSPSHSCLFQDWFLPSLNQHHRDGIELQVRYIPQLCATGEFKARGWTAAMLEKVALIEAAINENWGTEFIYSDVDVQFLGNILPILKQLPPSTDLFFQRDAPNGMVCAGFFLCRGNERTAAFWKSVGKRLRGGLSIGDQDAVNALLRGPQGLTLKSLAQSWRRRATAVPTFGYLPDSFFGAGTVTGKSWHPGDTFPLPENPLVHHANWTEGIANKLAQLAWVSRTLDCRSAPPRATIGTCSTERGSDSIA